MKQFLYIFPFLIVVGLLSCDRPPPEVKVLTEYQKTSAFRRYPEVGKTYISYGDFHGYQVSYYASSTKSWLWYPNNNKALPGQWKRDGLLICFKRGPNTYNPATQQRGGSFQCTVHHELRKTILAELKGDVFGIAGGKIPYKLQRCKPPKEFGLEPELVKKLNKKCKVFDRQNFLTEKRKREEWLRSPEGKAYLARIQEDVMRRLKERSQQ